MRYSLALFAGVLVGLSSVATVSLPATPQQLRPVYLDYSTQRTRVVSPDGKIAISVTGGKASLAAWVTINEPIQGWVIQVWPIERSVDVLWQPDSKAFALTDNRYANESYVLIIGTEFHMSGEGLGVSMVDITPLLRAEFLSAVRQYYLQHYHTSEFDASYSFYTRALRWVNDDSLLVGVSGITSLKMSPLHLGAASGVKGLTFGYVFDVSKRKIVTTLSVEAVKKQYGIDISRLAGGVDVTQH